MAKRFSLCKVFLLMSSAGFLSLGQTAYAAAFQLWEQDGASIGNYHAGYAAIAEDASTSFYNPAGLVRIHNQQFVLGADPVFTDFIFRGTVQVNNDVDSGLPTLTSAQGGNFALVPNLHYAAPLLDNLVFGLSTVVPFGLKTDWGYAPVTRYVATVTSLMVVDISPTFGFGITDKLSVGAGLDAEQASAEFDLVGGQGASDADTKSINKGSGKGYGFHLGALYQFSPATRLGLSFHSQVIHKLRGTSAFVGPLANEANGGTQISTGLRTEFRLPASTSLSFFHTYNPQWDVMATISYIQWSVFNQIILNNTAGVDIVGGGSTTVDNLQVTVAQHYHNSWNYALGSNYHVNEKWMIRTGLGYDQTPSNDRYRNLALPDSDRYIIAIGGHFQATNTIGLDMSWAHFFMQNTRINSLTQIVGSQISTTNGIVQGGGGCVWLSTEVGHCLIKPSSFAFTLRCICATLLTYPTTYAALRCSMRLD